MFSAWVAFSLHLPQEHQRVFPILLVTSSEPDDSFPFLFTDSFETQGLYMYGFSFVKWEKYSSSELSLSLVPLFSSSRALFTSSGPDIFMMKLVYSSKFVFNFPSLLYVLYKKAFSTIAFLKAMTSMIRKKLITFFFE